MSSFTVSTSFYSKQKVLLLVLLVRTESSHYIVGFIVLCCARCCLHCTAVPSWRSWQHTQSSTAIFCLNSMVPIGFLFSLYLYCLLSHHTVRANLGGVSPLWVQCCRLNLKQQFSSCCKAGNGVRRGEWWGRRLFSSECPPSIHI